MPRKHSQLKHTPYTGVSSSCGDKKRYKSEHDIQKAIEIIELQRPQVELDYYQCLDCSHWHLTSRKNR